MSDLSKRVKLRFNFNVKHIISRNVREIQTYLIILNKLVVFKYEKWFPNIFNIFEYNFGRIYQC